MDVRAAVAYAPGKPLEVTTVKLDGPRAGEVLIEIKATGICHTDEFTLSGACLLYTSSAHGAGSECCSWLGTHSSWTICHSLSGSSAWLRLNMPRRPIAAAPAAARHGYRCLRCEIGTKRLFKTTMIARADTECCQPSPGVSFRLVRAAEY